jgi:hypothetical protein
VSRLPLAILASSLALGCDSAPHPWDQAGASDVASPPPVRSALSPAGSAIAPVSGAGSAEDPVLPVPIGGAWVHCYGHFKPSGEPKKDVTRLGLLCGPSNGMKQEGDLFESDLTEGSAPAEYKIEAQRGACYRIFAVGEVSILDLDVTLRSSRGSAIAADHGQDAWPIVQPDRPICALEDDRWTVEVRAKRGGGRFAAEVWALAKPVH